MFAFLPGSGISLVYEKLFIWTQDILVNPKAKPGATTLHFRIQVQVCDDEKDGKSGICEITEHDFNLPVTIADPLPEEAAGHASPGVFDRTQSPVRTCAFLEMSGCDRADSRRADKPRTLQTVRGAA